MAAEITPLPQTEKFERVGLGYRKTYSDGVILTVNRLRESRGEWSGELQVDRRHEQVGVTEYLGSFRWNLSSLTSRKTAATYLNERAGDADIRWLPRLDLFANDVLLDRRKGAELQMIGADELGDEPANLIGPLCPVQEITTLYAPGGAGKSTLAAAITVSVETGREVIPGWTPAYSAPVLVLDFEGRWRTWHQRLAAIFRGIGVPPRNVRYMSFRGRLSDHLEQIATVVSEHAIGFVIVDSVEAASGAGDGEGWNDRVQALFEAVGKLNTTALLIDHVTGDDAKRDDGADRPYGGVFKVNWSRQVWRLVREKEPVDGQAELLLTNTKYNEGPKHAPVGLLMTYRLDGAITLRSAEVEAPELVTKLSRTARMQRCLRVGEQTTKAVAEACDMKESDVRQLLTRRRDLFVRLSNDRIGLAAHV